MLITQRWPGITHDNVWSMPYFWWVRYVQAAEEYVEWCREQERQANARR